MERVRFFRAFTPFGYVFERPWIVSATETSRFESASAAPDKSTTKLGRDDGFRPENGRSLLPFGSHLAVSSFVRYIHYLMDFAAALRRDLIHHAHKHALSRELQHALTYGDNPSVCFAPYQDESRHGNFLDESYRQIRSNPFWRKRLAKVHTQARKSLPLPESGRWRELDSCNSSDALLMNIFCYPRVLKKVGTAAFLGMAPGSSPHFGFMARVPLVGEKLDRTEVDMKLGTLLVEAKLTETDFQTAEKQSLLAYRDFLDVFDESQLPQTEDRYVSYQLLRNILAAHALKYSFCVLLDARRLDLIRACYEVIKCVRPIKLRTELSILTWQELARVVPLKLRTFLSTKYGIHHAPGDKYPELRCPPVSSG